MERREDRRIGKTWKTDKTGGFGYGKENRKSLDAAPDREEQAAKISRLEFLIRRISGILVSDRAETENGSAASAVIGGRGYTEGEFSDIVYYAETLKRIFGEESGRGEEAADVPEVPDIPEEWAEMLGKVVCGIWRGKIWTGDMVGKMSGGGKGENSIPEPFSEFFGIRGSGIFLQKFDGKTFLFLLGMLVLRGCGGESAEAGRRNLAAYCSG